MVDVDFSPRTPRHAQGGRAPLRVFRGDRLPSVHYDGPERVRRTSVVVCPLLSPPGCRPGGDLVGWPGRAAPGPHTITLPAGSTPDRPPVHLKRHRVQRRLRHPARHHDQRRCQHARSQSRPDLRRGARWPAGVSFVSANTDNGRCTEASGTVTCNIGYYTNGGVNTVRIVVRPTASGVLTNSVTVTTGSFDPDGTNNSATVTTTADLNCTTPRPGVGHTVTLVSAGVLRVDLSAASTAGVPNNRITSVRFLSTPRTPRLISRPPVALPQRELRVHAADSHGDALVSHASGQRWRIHGQFEVTTPAPTVAGRWWHRRALMLTRAYGRLAGTTGEAMLASAIKLTLQAPPAERACLFDQLLHEIATRAAARAPPCARGCTPCTMGRTAAGVRQRHRALDRRRSAGTALARPNVRGLRDHVHHHAEVVRDRHDDAEVRRDARVPADAGAGRLPAP